MTNNEEQNLLKPRKEFINFFVKKTNDELELLSDNNKFMKPTRKLTPTSPVSKETFLDYRKKLEARKKQTRKSMRNIIRPEVNGFNKLGHDAYLDD